MGSTLRFSGIKAWQRDSGKSCTMRAVPALGLVFCAGLCVHASAKIVINEVARQPAAGGDWFELFNTANDDVSLAGWEVQDENLSNREKLGAGECAQVHVVPASGYLVLERDAPCGISFGLGGKDEIVLLDADGDVVDTVSWGRGDIPKEVTLGRLPDGSERFELLTPSKGQSNNEAKIADVAPGSTSRTGGELNIKVNKDDVLANERQADRDGACCKILREAGWRSDLPAIVVDTRGARVPDDPKVHGEMCTCAGSALPDVADFKGWVGIERRGNSSQRQNDKQSYAIETRFPDKDASGSYDGDRFPLLGLPSEKDWALYGPEADPTMGMRNWMAFWAARQMGRWAPRTQYVELFLIRDEAGLEGLDIRKHYEGIYLLMETVERGDHRVAVSELIPEDLSGGYIMKHDNDNYGPDEATIRTPTTGLVHIFRYPRRPSREARAWLTDWLDAFDRALVSDDFKDEERGYRAFADVPSFVDYQLAVEFTKNPDGYRGSTYFYKDRGGKLMMGPVWDYNEAFGICCGYPIEGWDKGGVSGPGQSGGSAISPEGWRFNICNEPERCLVDPADGVSQWYRRMWEDGAYVAAVAERWKQLRAGPLSNDAITEAFDGTASEIRLAVLRNGVRWRGSLETRGYRNWADKWERSVADMRQWILWHVDWMDSALAAEVEKLARGGEEPPRARSGDAPVVQAASGP